MARPGRPAQRLLSALFGTLLAVVLLLGLASRADASIYWGGANAFADIGQMTLNPAAPAANKTFLAAGISSWGVATDGTYTEASNGGEHAVPPARA
jgi:hypothetical protein